MTLSSTTWPTSTRTHNSITLYVVANAAVAKIGLVRDAAVVKLCRVVSWDSAKTQSAAAAGPWLDLAPSFFALVQTAFVASRIVPGTAAVPLATAPCGKRCHRLAPATLVHHPHLQGGDHRI